MIKFVPPRTLWRWLVTQLYWRVRLQRLGSRSVLFRPLMLVGARYIEIGQRTSIREFARLEVIAREEVEWTPRLIIGADVNIEQGAHIVCHCSVTIGDRVSITPYCCIVDTYHPHDPPDLPPKIGLRLPRKRSSVTIGEGTFVGTHSTILPNVTIGKGCVIGAGSVVTRDLPDYAIATGAPARIVKIFDPKSRTWTKP